MSEVITRSLGICHGSHVSAVDFPLHVHDFQGVQTFVILLVPHNNHEACDKTIFTFIVYMGQQRPGAIQPPAQGHMMSW